MIKKIGYVVKGNVNEMPIKLSVGVIQKSINMYNSTYLGAYCYHKST